MRAATLLGSAAGTAYGCSTTSAGDGGNVAKRRVIWAFLTCVATLFVGPVVSPIGASAISAPVSGAVTGPVSGPVSAVAPAATRSAARMDVGIAYARLGGGVTSLGRLQSAPAWSTIKVPLAVAAYQRRPSPLTRRLIEPAITRSDNAAAQALWAGLGGGPAAARAVDQVLTRYGDTRTRTQTRRVRAGFTPFGQTAWSLAAQVRFVETFAARAPRHPVLAAMGRVVPGQRWGLGRIPGARFKGGWGPGTDGRYLVRQFGLITVNGHRYSVALAARSADGSYAGGIKALDVAVAQLRTRLR